MQNIPINPHVTPTECHTENSPNVTSGSSQFHSQLEDLKSLPVPYNELYHTLSSYNNIPIRILCDRIRKATTEIEAWLEAAKSALFGLEVEVKQDGVKAYKQDVNEIEMITSRFYPNVEMMLELNSKVGSKLDSHADQDQSNTDESAESKGPLLSTEELQQIVKAIHSSWLSLKAMLDEIRGIFAIAQTRREILTHMEDILVEIEQIGLVTDKLQEERSRQTSEAVGSEHGKTSSSLSNSISTHSTDTTMNTDTSKEKNRNTEVLAGIDSRIEALKPRVERLTMQVERLPSLDFKCDELQDQYDELLRLWDDAKTRREKIGDEIKEERWLAVFGQVAGQVESMMESLDRAIVHCKGLVDQIKVMVKDEVVPTAPIDRDHLYTIFKSFESKHKYYAPAVTKMLNMLENGIQNRATKNADAIQKHKDMKAKWEKLQGSLDLVELDLDGIEAMLDQLDASIPSSHIVTPPAQLPEKPLFAMRQSQIQSELKSPGPPVLFEPSPQDQEPQRGRQPFPSPVPSRSSAESSEPTSRTRNRSPPSGQPRQRPWSPTPSVASQSSMLSPSMFGSRRSFSRSPSRSPSRATSDKLRPWCPSTKTTSPSIPGIPYTPSPASTYTPRSVSSTRQDRAVSPSPEMPSRSVSTASRARSASCAPSLNRPSSQSKPIFSPAGSTSKISTGIYQSRATSPSPRANANTSGAGGRKTQSKFPPPVIANGSPRSQQSSLSVRAPPPRRSSSPIPYSSTGRTEPTSVLNSSDSSLPSTHRKGRALSPPASQRSRTSARPARSVSQMGFRSDSDSKQRHRRPSLGNQLMLSTSKETKIIEGNGMSSLHGPPAPELITESTPSMRLEVCAVPLFGSVDSSSSPVPSQLQQREEQQQQLRPRKLDPLDFPQGIKPYIAVRGDELDEEFARVLNANPISIQVRRLGEGKYYFGGRMEERGPGKIVAVGGKTVLCRLMERGRSATGAGDSNIIGGGSFNGVEEAIIRQQQQPNQQLLRPSTSQRSRSRDASNLLPPPLPNPLPIVKTPRKPEPVASRSTRTRASSFNALGSSIGSVAGRNRKIMVRVGGGWQDLDLHLLTFRG